MSGNVEELTSDCSEGDCSWRIMRGGHYDNFANGLRSKNSLSLYYAPLRKGNSYYTSETTGFRLAHDYVK